MRALALLLILSTLPLSAEQGLAIRVSPLVTQPGRSLWLTCRVTPDRRNRRLVFGIAGTEREHSERQLDGYDAPITWGPMEIPRVPCGAGPAYCRVERQGDRALQVMQQIVVAGCDEGTK